MPNDDIGSLVEKYINDNYVLNPEDKPSVDQSLLESGIIDSTSVLTLVMFLEEKFNISVQDEELVPDNLDSITNIASYVSRKLSKS